MKSFTSRFASSSTARKLMEGMPNPQSISFSARNFSSGQSSKKPEFNILFFCPRNEEHFRNFETIYPDLIRKYNPKSISISDIAHKPENSSTAVTSLLKENITPSVIIPHLVLIGHTKKEADRKIQLYRDSGIESILVIRGNPATVQKDVSYTHNPEGYEDMPHLMKRIKELAPEMKIIVAGYPEKHPYDINAERGLDELKKKVDCGADMIITQHFFNNIHFLEFLEGCQKRNIGLPIIPSIMPIGNPKYLFNFSKSAGIDVPAEVAQILFGQEGLTTNSEDITDPVVRQKAIKYTAGHIKSIIDLNLPQVDRINTYTANNEKFLSQVLDMVGVNQSITESKDGGRT